LYQIFSVDFNFDEALSKVLSVFVDLAPKPYQLVAQSLEVILGLGHRLFLYHLDLVCRQVLARVLNFYYFLLSEFISLYHNIVTTASILIIKFL